MNLDDSLDRTGIWLRPALTFSQSSLSKAPGHANTCPRVGTPPICGGAVSVMRTATPNLASRETSEFEQKRLALTHLQDAWADAFHDGVDADCLAQTSLFLALAELVSTYGEEATARFSDTLSTKIRNGEYSIKLSRQ
jgi:hypothetical protein